MSPYPGPGGRQADDRQATGRRRTMASVMLWATFILEYIMSVQISVLTDTFAVAPQIDPGDIAEIAAAASKSIITNSPDFAGGLDQPASADLTDPSDAAGFRERTAVGEGKGVVGRWE